MSGLRLGANTDPTQATQDGLAVETGALFFTTGKSAMTAIPFMGNVGIALSGLRNSVYNLHEALAPKGIYAGTLSIWGFIKKDDPQKRPDQIATRIYEMCDLQKLMTAGACLYFTSALRVVTAAQHRIGLHYSVWQTS